MCVSECVCMPHSTPIKAFLHTPRPVNGEWAPRLDSLFGPDGSGTVQLNLKTGMIRQTLSQWDKMYLGHQIALVHFPGKTEEHMGLCCGHGLQHNIDGYQLANTYRTHAVCKSSKYLQVATYNDPLSKDCRW